MAVAVYRWDNAGAPQLSGTAGALIAVLDYVLVTGQGWSKVFSGANLAVYRAPVGAGNRFYLRVDDTGTTTARIVAYEAMTDVNTGTNPFPTATQIAGGLYVNKSDTASTAARAWVIAASDRLFHVWTMINGVTTVSAATYGGMWSFGDIKSFKAADGYGTIIVGNTGGGYSGNGFCQCCGVSASVSGLFVCRSYTQTGTSLACGRHSDTLAAGASPFGTNGLPYPNPADGGIYLAPVRITEPAASVMRGTVPGLWVAQHPQTSFNCLDTFSGSGAMAGRTFMFLHQYSSSMVVLETSNTWDV